MIQYLDINKTCCTEVAVTIVPIKVAQFLDKSQKTETVREPPNL